MTTLVCKHCWTEANRHLLLHDWEHVWNEHKGQNGAKCSHCQTWAWASKSSVCPARLEVELPEGAL